jgi:chemosensory pili system protein ChpA (sensor histidine kinase/response regulator)
MNSSSHAPRIDTGPLSWVIGEIRDSLGRSGSALGEAVAASFDARATALQHAKTHLHQAHGALQMVDIDGVSLLTLAAELALDRFKDGAIACSAEHAAIVTDAYGAVVEYLDELLGGAPSQPTRLFPYYRALQALQGVERIHPADLLFVDLSMAVSLDTPASADVAPDYAACRARFEKALLPFMKSVDADTQRSYAQKLQDAIEQVAPAQAEPHARAFWHAMHAFAALVATGQLASNLYVKQLFGMINLQLRRLSQGQGGLPESMLRDALFFIAAAENPSAESRALRRAYHLDGLVPPDYAERRYGRIDAAALKEAKEALAQTKSGWDKIASNAVPTGANAVAPADSFNQSLATLAGASDKLGAPALAQLLRELGQAASEALAANRSDELGMEMATAMLFVEQGLDQVRQLPADFEEHAEIVGARLLALAAGETPPAAPQWQGELAQKTQHGQTVTVLAGEIKASLRQIEKTLDDYHAGVVQRPALVNVEPLLHQLQGALSVLDQDAAVRAVRRVQADVHGLAIGTTEGGVNAPALQLIARNVGALGFFTDMLAQDGVQAGQRFVFDEQDGVFHEIPFEETVQEASPFEPEEEALAPAAPAVPEPAPVPAPEPAVAEAPDGDDAIEAELLEIFISEAQEVLALVAENIPAAERAPASPDILTQLRRSFHTLKGSGRMVGLDEIGIAAAAIEKCMNLWLAEARSATPELLGMLQHACVELTAWVGELAATGRSSRTGAALAAAAEHVQNGTTAQVEEIVAPALPAPAEPDVAEAPLDETFAATEEIAAVALPVEDDDALPWDDTAIPVLDDVAPAGEVVAEVAEVADAADAPAPDDNMKRVGDLVIPLPLYNIYLAETDDLMRLLQRDFAAWRETPQRAVTVDALKAAHTLVGTSATVGFQALCDVAHALENVLETLQAPAPVLEEAQRALIEEALVDIATMLAAFARAELAENQPLLVARLNALCTELAARAPAPDDEDSRLHTLFTDTLASLVAAPPVFAEPAVAEAAGAPAANDDFDDLFGDPLDQATPGAAEALAPVEAPEPVAEAGPEPEPEPEPEPVAAPEPAFAREAEPERVLTGDTAFSDELDADLMPVFLEEATDLMPELGNSLRQWQATPADTAPAQRLLRTLHTVKGSARMAGAMRLGQHIHELETQVENMVHAGTTAGAAFDELLANYDQALLLFEQLQNPQPEVTADGAPQDGAAPASPAASDDSAAPAAHTALVRVRADILDRLVNQAGEVSITRSKLENQVSGLKSSLGDFAENLARLRRQLREVEIQAETQMASRMSIAGEREFDPLEFDRFTRLQELTRMMAESVNDVASFHDTLARSIDGATEDLAAQSRLTRDLQRDLMRVRMVPFASLSERLFRVARQTAKEIDKRVNLDIRGGSVEIDRSVLEQMAAPFEHLLRNAIVHGVESRVQRGMAGKSETGELLVQVSQQGNEVVIAFSDDGAGLDLDRIRAKALEKGLVAEGVELNDVETGDLIFMPGFSTADALTELAGRGVGMDVVRTQAQLLGGRVALATEAGKGARFTIHLPLTLAVTQVVLASSGGKTWALPSNLIEQVLQLKEAALLEAHAAGVVSVQGQMVPLQFLSTLLGDAAAPVAQRSAPVMILSSGNDRVAVQVDEVLGNREVVIKNIGPQLARMVGISGATVLGNGAIVLILNPIALAHQNIHSDALKMRDAAVPEAPVRTAVVMVVDDSLTVRRVTQRLLEREGYQVQLAKDGVDALEQLQQATPDLMLVDIEMPRMDGFDLTRNVRGGEKTAGIPIIMITSRTADKHRNYALDLGVNAYFGKPFQEPVLLAAIAGLLGKDMPAKQA